MPRIRALLLALAAVASVLPEGRAAEPARMLSAAESAPWKGVGRVNVATTAQRAMCTGTLIAPDLVLTAAHCVSDLGGRAFPPGIVHFVAGWHLGQKAAHRKAAAISLHARFRPAERPGPAELERDLALVRLDGPIPPEAARPFPVAAPPPSAAPLTLVGYRRDRAHALSRQDGCAVVAAFGDSAALACEVVQGVSGSPVFASIGGQQHLVAMVVAMGRSGGRAVAFAVRADRPLADLMAQLPAD